MIRTDANTNKTNNTQQADYAALTSKLLNSVSDEALEATGSTMVLGGVAAHSAATQSCCWTMKC